MLADVRGPQKHDQLMQASEGLLFHIDLTHALLRADGFHLVTNLVA